MQITHDDAAIYCGAAIILPLADVQHIEPQSSGGLIIVTSHTRWDMAADVWANPAFVPESEAEAFLSAWRTFRAIRDRLVFLGRDVSHAVRLLESATES